MPLLRRALIALTGIFVMAALAFPVVSHAGTCWDYTKSERKFKRQTNHDRADNGFGRLSLDPQLSKVARHQAHQMARQMYIFHTSRLGQKVTNWWAVGENVGFGGHVTHIENEFMNSPSHRSNILYPDFHYVGVGSVWAHDRLWVSVVFESEANPGTTMGMPGC